MVSGLCRPKEQGWNTYRRCGTKGDGEHGVNRCREGDQSDYCHCANSRCDEVRRSNAIASRCKGKVEAS